MAPPRTTSDTENLSTAGAAVFARHYLLERAVETGPTTAVWRATDRRDGQTFALKFFPPELIRTPTDFLTVRDLIAPVRQLQHPHVVPAAEVATDQDFSAVVTPWIDGPTLVDARLKQAQRCFAISDIETWVHTLVDVFATAHAHGIVHGALTPHVVFVRPGQGLGVSGFGINGWLRLASRTIFGPPKHDQRAPYASPAVRHGALPQPLDDVFAFGAIVYELITGAVPRGASTFRRHRHAVPMEQQRRKLKHFGTPIPPTWEALVQACLEPEASRRIQSFVEIRTRLGFIPPEPMPEGTPSAIVPGAIDTADSPAEPATEMASLVPPAATPAGADDFATLDSADTSVPAATFLAGTEPDAASAGVAQDAEPSPDDSTAPAAVVSEDPSLTSSSDEASDEPRAVDDLLTTDDPDPLTPSREEVAEVAATLPVDDVPTVEADPEFVEPVSMEAAPRMGGEFADTGTTTDIAAKTPPVVDAATVEPLPSEGSPAVEDAEAFAPPPVDQPPSADDTQSSIAPAKETADDDQETSVTVPQDAVPSDEVAAPAPAAADTALTSSPAEETTPAFLERDEPPIIATPDESATTPSPVDEPVASGPTDPDTPTVNNHESETVSTPAEAHRSETAVAVEAAEAASTIEKFHDGTDRVPEESTSNAADTSPASENVNPAVESPAATDVAFDTTGEDAPTASSPDVEPTRKHVDPVSDEAETPVATAGTADTDLLPATESAEPVIADAPLDRTPPFTPTTAETLETPAESVVDEWRPRASTPSPVPASPSAPRDGVAARASSTDEADDADSDTPTAAYIPLEPLLPRRGPLRHVPSPADQPRVLFPRSSYYERHDNALGPRLVRGALYLILLVGLVGGGWWGWQTYQARQEYIELWRDVQLFPPDANAAERDALAVRLEDARPRLSRKQWQDLHEAWENQPANRTRQ